MPYKIILKLESDEEGYPPVAHEKLNANKISMNRFAISNAPFFVANISYPDIVKAHESEELGLYNFDGLIQGSSFTSISVIILDPQLDVFLMDLFRGLNCAIEYGEFGNFRMLAIAIPAATNYQQLRNQLTHLELQEKLSFSELAVAHKI